RRRSSRASPRGRRRSATGSSCFGEHVLVRLEVEQLLDLVGARHADADQPAVAVWVIVHGLRCVDDAWFTSSTSPEGGEMRSETAFTDSTSPYELSFETVAPTSGGS